MSDFTADEEEAAIKLISDPRFCFETFVKYTGIAIEHPALIPILTRTPSTFLGLLELQGADSVLSFWAHHVETDVFKKLAKDGHEVWHKETELTKRWAIVVGDRTFLWERRRHNFGCEWGDLKDFQRRYKLVPWGKTLPKRKTTDPALVREEVYKRLIGMFNRKKRACNLGHSIMKALDVPTYPALGERNRYRGNRRPGDNQSPIDYRIDDVTWKTTKEETSKRVKRVIVGHGGKNKIKITLAQRNPESVYSWQDVEKHTLSLKPGESVEPIIDWILNNAPKLDVLKAYKNLQE